MWPELLPKKFTLRLMVRDNNMINVNAQQNPMLSDPILRLACFDVLRLHFGRGLLFYHLHTLYLNVCSLQLVFRLSAAYKQKGKFACLYIVRSLRQARIVVNSLFTCTCSEDSAPPFHSHHPIASQTNKKIQEHETKHGTTII